MWAKATILGSLFGAIYFRNPNICVLPLAVAFLGFLIQFIKHRRKYAKLVILQQIPNLGSLARHIHYYGATSSGSKRIWGDERHQWTYRFLKLASSIVRMVYSCSRR